MFAKEVKGTLSLFQKASTGGSEEELLLESLTDNLSPQSYSGDGRYLLYLARASETAGDLWVLPMDRKLKPFKFLVTKAEERSAQFSPDGRWVAYMSDVSGQPEIYVRPFPPVPVGEWPVSTMGGATPRWRKDGSRAVPTSRRTAR